MQVIFESTGKFLGFSTAGTLFSWRILIANWFLGTFGDLL